MLSACQPVGDGPQSGSQEEKGGRGVQTTEPTAEGGRVGDAIWIFEGGAALSSDLCSRKYRRRAWLRATRL